MRHFCLILILGGLLTSSLQAQQASEILAQSMKAYQGIEAIAVEAVREEAVDYKNQSLSSTVKYEYALRGREKFRIVRKDAASEGFLISDGQFTWRALADRKEWSKLEAAGIVDDEAEDTKNSRLSLTKDTKLALLGRGYGFVKKAANTATLVKEESVKLENRRAECWLFRAELEGMAEEAWIDKTTFLVVQHHRKGKVNYNNTLSNYDSKVRFRSVHMNAEVPESAFQFTPSPKWREVEFIVLPGEERAQLAGAPAANFTLKSLDGAELTLADYRGKVVVLDFWATWCPPCIKSMPGLQKLHAELGERGFAVVGVSNEEMSTLRGFIKNNKYTFPIAQDGKRDVHQRYGIRAFPTTFLIGRDGKIREQIVGTLSEAALRRKIEALLGERAQGQ